MKTKLWAGAAALALVQALACQAHAEAAAAEAAATAVDEIVVLGRGETRQVQTVSGEELALEMPGASPLKLVDKLPNVNLQSADPFGSYEWSARISIRSFNQSQLGFTLDDVPLGDMTYGNHNGLHISRAIAGENVGSVELAQGAGALDTASANNLGGSLKYVSRAPSAEFGGQVAATAGSDNTYRGFVRLDSGELPTGLRSYVSYSYNTADKWKGDGKQKHQQVNFKAVQPIGEGSLTGWLNWSKRRENDYQDMSLAMLDRLGSNWDNISGDWDLIVRIAEIANNRGETGVTPAHPELGTTYPAPIVSADDAYYNAAGLRDDLIGAVTLDLPVAEVFKFRATLYGHNDEGQGLWGTPYVPSPNYGQAGATTNDAPISIRTTEYDLSRYGLVGSGTLELGAHSINAGVWYEDNEFNQARRYYGLNRSAPQRSFLDMQSNPFRTDWEYDFSTTTWQFHIQDTWTVTEALTLNAGFKSLSVENEGRTVFARTASLEKNGTIKAEKNFLPQAGVRYELNPDSELFAAYSRNMRAFPSSGTSGPFSSTKAGFDAIRDNLKPEISDTFEAGWRFRTGDFQGVLAAYHVKFKDRLFSVPVGSGIVGNPSALSNVGGVTAKGFEAVGTWNFAENWSLFGSYAYNDSTYDDDTFDGNGALVARTAGKTTVDTPKHLLKGELGYDDGAFFGRVSVSHLSKRYFTYENDQSVPSQTVADLAVGYRFSGSPMLEGLEAQVNVSNLFDEDYISTINSNGFPLRGDSQTLLPGAPRQVFFTLRKSF
ncbi:TonB-dependent receptor [Phenylobacterium sp.]|uniref:TonB-dependent receptor n=1 Tax=Phenylobacterium sp. TaxID=1871053 RepID=UPI00391A6D55